MVCVYVCVYVCVCVGWEGERGGVLPPVVQTPSCVCRLVSLSCFAFLSLLFPPDLFVSYLLRCGVG